MGGEARFDLISSQKTGDINAVVNKDELQKINIFPNPMQDRCFLLFNNTYKIPATLSILDLHGREMRKVFDIRTDKVIIEREDLQAGVYFLILYNNDQQIGKGKLLVK